MKTDDLDALSDNDLSETFAVELAGWNKGLVRWPPGEPDETPGWIPPAEKSPFGYPCCPPFATSADAVLPWLEKLTYPGRPPAECVFMDGKWTVYLQFFVPVIKATSTSLPRAVATVLIRAARAAK